MRPTSEIPRLGLEEPLPEDQLDLQEGLRAVGASCMVESRQEGPRVVVYHVRPTEGVQLTRLRLRMDDLAVRLGVPGASLRVEGGAVFIEVARTSPTLPRREDMEEPADPADLLVGINSEGAPVTMRLERLAHMICAGTTGMGKGVALRNIIRSAQRIPGALICVVDPKADGDFLPDGIHQTGPSVTWVESRMRGAWSSTVQNAAVYFHSLKGGLTRPRHKPAPGAPLVLIIDELQSLVGDPVNRMNLRTILSQGRSRHIHCVMATQAPSAALLGGNDMRVNAPTRLVLRVASASDSRVALTQGGAEKLLPDGDAFLLYQGRLTRLQIPWLEPPA